MKKEKQVQDQTPQPAPQATPVPTASDKTQAKRQLKELARSLLYSDATSQEVMAILVSRNLKLGALFKEDDLEEMLEEARKENKTSRQAEARTLMQEMNRKHAVVMLNGRVCILNKPSGEQDNEITYCSPQDLKLRYQNRFFHDKPLDKWWLPHPDREEFMGGVVFAPNLKVPPDQYNLWKGFAVQPKKGDCSRFMYHLEHVIADSSQEVFEFLLNYLAHGVQKTWEKPRSALVMRSDPGAGKGTLVDYYCPIFGVHYQQITDPEHLLGRFNSHMQNCVFLYADEAMWAGNKEGEGKLKALITEKKIRIEIKGRDSFQLDNFTRVLFSSNKDWVVPMEINDRRFFVMDVSNRHKGDTEYFGALHWEMENGGRAALLYDLLQRDITEFVPTLFPQTKAMLEQKLHSFTPLQTWWFEILNGTYDVIPDAVHNTKHELHFDKPFDVPCDAFFRHFKDFCRIIERKDYTTPNQFGVSFRKFFKPTPSEDTVPQPEQGHLRRTTVQYRGPWVYQIPPLKLCQEIFQTVIKTPIRWSNEQEAWKNSY